MLIDCSHTVQAAGFHALRCWVKKAGGNEWVWQY